MKLTLMFGLWNILYFVSFWKSIASYIEILDHLFDIWVGINRCTVRAMCIDLLNVQGFKCQMSIEYLLYKFLWISVGSWVWVWVHMYSYLLPGIVQRLARATSVISVYSKFLYTCLKGKRNSLAKIIIKAAYRASLLTATEFTILYLHSTTKKGQTIKFCKNQTEMSSSEVI